MSAVKKAPKQNKKQESIEATLWQAADKLRKNMDAAEYKHVVLGLIFLKYISDAFADLHSKLLRGEGECEGADPEDPNEYTAEKVFLCPADCALETHFRKCQKNGNSAGKRQESGNRRLC